MGRFRILVELLHRLAAGVIFVSKAFAQHSPRSVIRALSVLIQATGEADWTDRAHWL